MMQRSNKGTIVAFLALMLPVVLGMGALVTDLSMKYENKTKVKNAIDFATLAGISQLTSQANVSNAKQTALTYLNNNLTMSLPSFSPLSLNSTGLSIQAGVYDFNNMSFTLNEQSPNVNALKISYTYNSSTFLSRIFMITNSTLTENSTVAKQVAAHAQPGSGFPMVIYNSVLDDARQNNNMVNLYSAGNMDNSFWTDFTDSNPSTTDIRNVLDYFQTGMGTQPPAISVDDPFRVNDGGMGGIFMNMNPNVLVGMTFVFPVVTPTHEYIDHKLVKADGFVSGTIDSIVDSMGQKYIGITIQPGYIDNTFGGLQIGSGVTNLSSSNQALSSSAFGIVQ